MLTDIFYWLLNMSAAAIPVGLCLLLIRRFPRIPRRMCFGLWLIPLCRLWIPIFPKNRYSVMKLIMTSSSKLVPVSEPLGDYFGAMNMWGAAEGYFPVSFRAYATYRVFLAATWVWFAVFLLLLLWITLVYVNGIHTCKMASHCSDNIYYSNTVSSAAVFGILRPKILLSPSIAIENHFYVLLHEKAHIRRLDNLWRLVGILTAVLHWFNPFVWIFLKCFFTDMEQACDERALLFCTAEQRREYAAALLDTYENSSILSSAFGGGGLRSRILRILTYRKMTLLSMLCLSILAITIAYVFLTNPK